ncbi:caffeine-induced death protein 2-domain-containing protein [Russula ochroleuca]|uniref:Caffeine-induced death protein 2-domain-containing protein n=1 Tax=Russula ochroleuca TaxID=152965 RepID=A0A9P5N2T4_9AGAM|nr:caffeine-induced death protein 2-domain-containing protein [Russula ochroleuca]
MSPRVPALGSLAVQSPSQSSQLVHVSPATCHNLSLFKELLKEYRKVDDAVTTRINRTTAQFRDRDRLGASGKGSVQEQACAYLWKELVANWKRRAEIIDYCVKVVDEAQVGQSDHRAGTDVGTRPSSSSLSLGGTDEAKYRQVHNELAIEKIIRRRSIDAFVSRCRYFEPPQSDADGQRWWKEAHERR